MSILHVTKLTLNIIWTAKACRSISVTCLPVQTYKQKSRKFYIYPLNIHLVSEKNEVLTKTKMHSFFQEIFPSAPSSFCPIPPIFTFHSPPCPHPHKIFPFPFPLIPCYQHTIWLRCDQMPQFVARDKQQKSGKQIWCSCNGVSLDIKYIMPTAQAILIKFYAPSTESS